MTALEDIAPEVLARILGAELRDERRARGWTRKDLHSHLGRDLALQTIATWELGTRKISVQSLFDTCGALKLLPSAVLAAVEARCEIGRDELAVDLRDLAVHGPPELAPARRWAHATLRPGLPTRVLLIPEAVRLLAELCEIEVSEMEEHLRVCGTAEERQSPEEDAVIRDHVPVGHGARS
jgi:transcriptional regulator with XRE-family HTH domain